MDTASNEGRTSISSEPVDAAASGDTNQPRRRARLRIAKRVGGPAVGVLGLALSVYFYYASIKERDLQCAIDPVRTLLAIKDRPAAVKIVAKGEEIDADVFAVNIAIWNEGRESIRDENVLVPVLITVPLETKILQASVVRQSRPLTEFQVFTDGPEIPANSARVSWRILDHNDGGIIQLVLAGTFVSQPVVSGVIESQGSVRIATSPEIRGMPSKGRPSKLGAAGSIFVSVIWLITGCIWFSLARDGLSAKRTWARQLWFYFTIVANVLFVWSIYKGVSDYVNIVYPPFGFNV